MGEGGGARVSQNSGKYFSGNYYVKFGHFVHFSYIFFSKNVLPT